MLPAQGMQSQQRALQGALRREARAAAQGKHLQEELREVQDLLRRRDMDNQRSKMIIRLKEDRIARLEVITRCSSALVSA